MITAASAKFLIVSISGGKLPPCQVLNSIVMNAHITKANSHLPELVFRNRKKDPANKVANSMATKRTNGILRAVPTRSRILLNDRNRYPIRRAKPAVRTGSPEAKNTRPDDRSG